MRSKMSEVIEFQTTFDDIFNAAFNSYQPDKKDQVEIDVKLSSVKDDALNKFEKYCLDKGIAFQKVVLGEDMILLTVSREHLN